MAKSEKKVPPLHSEAEKPNIVTTLMQAFETDSESAAKTLISEVTKTIFGSSEFGERQVLDEEMDCIIALMKGINPKDTLEAMYGAQIIVCQLLGMRKLSQNYPEDQKLGLNLLRLGKEVMQALEKKRSGGNQNITVNYNYSGEGKALMQTLISERRGQSAD